MKEFGEWDFDSPPFTDLGGYDEAARVFGGRAALAGMLESLNAAVFARDSRPPAE